VDGFDTLAQPLQVQRSIGALPENQGLYPRLTARENIRYYGRLHGLRGADLESRIDHLASLLEMEDFLERRTEGFSMGQRVKVAIARALVHNPGNVILDEPTAGLDPLMQRRFFDLIREENARGVTVFFSSHILGEVQRLCDRVGIIREGVLVAVEDVASLKAKALRRLEIRFASPPPLAAFEGLPGVRDLRIENSSLHSQVAGSLDAMIKAAALFEVLDLVSTEPSLEEIFLTYYA